MESVVSWVWSMKANLVSWDQLRVGVQSRTLKRSRGRLKAGRKTVDENAISFPNGSFDQSQSDLESSVISVRRALCVCFQVLKGSLRFKSEQLKGRKKMDAPKRREFKKRIPRVDTGSY